MLLALGGDGRNGNREESTEKTERVGRETESAVKILEELLIFGYRKNASDIHMEPWEDRFVIRMRIDGMMTMVREFDKSMYQPLVTRAKVISGMDIAKKESSAGRTFPGDDQRDPAGYENERDPDDLRGKDGAEISGQKDGDRSLRDIWHE